MQDINEQFADRQSGAQSMKPKVLFSLFNISFKLLIPTIAININMSSIYYSKNLFPFNSLSTLSSKQLLLKDSNREQLQI